MSADHPFVPGPRQTVDTIRHPAHGKCRAAYGHGENRLLLEDGSAVPVRVIGRGYSSEHGGLLDLRAEPGDPHATERPGDVPRVRCPLLAAGDTHERAWSPRLGEGWLVRIGGSGGEVRFEGDDGRATTFRWRAWEGIDSPATRALPPKKRKAHTTTDEDRRWVRYDTADGESMVFRSGGAPPPEPQGAPEQLALSGLGGAPPAKAKGAPVQLTLPDFGR